MALPNAYANYNNTKVMTASPAELTLLLYDGAIKFANIALMGIESGDVEKAHNNIVRTRRIVEEFKYTLDHKYGVAEDFERVYDYILFRLREANIHKSKEDMEEALKHLRTMRDTWKDVMKNSHSNAS